MTQDSGVELTQCYNKGCGKKFNPTENNDEDACLYHPGPPYFHDAYKIWNCCNKKSTDFGTWLSYPGCARGKHNPEKPADVVKVAAVTEIRPEKEEDVIVWNGLNKAAERIDTARQEKDLKMDVTPAARAAIQRYQDAHSGESSNDALKIGAPCRNNSCEKTYVGPESEREECVHHPGAAIFHEGMKYWSCCNKKTSDFGAFLSQKGCEKGKHQWSKNEKVDKLREDWFCANGMVTVNVYCKGTLPEEVKASSDGQMLRLRLVHGFGEKETELAYELFGHIDTDASKVVIGERKVEVILKQSVSASWPRLRYDENLDKDAETA